MEYFKALNINQKRFLVILISLTFSTLFYFLLPTSYKVNESTDYDFFYEPVANDIVNGKSLSDNSIRNNFRYPIGFPLILSMVFKISDLFYINRDFGVTIFSIFCFCFSSLIIFELYKLYLGSNLAIISSLIFITYPIVLWTIKQPNSETPFIPFLFLSIFLLFKIDEKNKLYYCILGFLLGCTMLIRPIGIFLPFVFSLIILYKFGLSNLKKSLISVAILLFSTLITVAPWEYYIYKNHNKIVLLSSGGTPSIVDGLTFNSNLKNYRQKLELSPDVQNVIDTFYKTINNDSQLRDIKEVVFNELINNPIAVIKLYILKLFRSLYATDSHRRENIIILIQLSYFFLSLFTVNKLFKNNIIGKFEILSIVFILLYFLLMSSLVLSILRYTTPIIALILPVLAGIFYKKAQ